MTQNFSRATSLRPAITVTALLASLVTCRPAQAQGVGAPVIDGNGLGIAFLVLENALALPPVIANTVIIARGRRPALAWPILGYVFGATQGVFGAAFLFPNLSGEGDNGLAAVGGVTLGLGVVNVGLATWALLLPRAPRRAFGSFDFSRDVRVLPLIGNDMAGRPQGVSLAVTNF
jgi:hypothetical protein